MSQDIVKAMQDLKANVSFGGGGDGGGGGNDSVGSYWGVDTGEISGRQTSPNSQVYSDMAYACAKGAVIGAAAGAADKGVGAGPEALAGCVYGAADVAFDHAFGGGR